ncbi:MULTISPECIES: hypothetical protein [Anaerotruncus]|jgi:hypothetical protein|uniref:hypothetical protein n=1 Tax=Anaerotruncus TaxID=244127 RepID=UPI00082B8D58|nr:MULTISPECIES: hypothetical protein [Anaerotruncus]RGX55538.1 hypothetical protein DWV16_08655 [Anaerotruncus sp. AF02-27]
MKRSAETGVNVGGASILVIFVLLCLTTFATLSLVSANADQKLSRKTAEATAAYYQADASAQTLLAEIDYQLKQIPLDSPESYFSAAETRMPGGVTLEQDAGSFFASYEVPIDESHTLKVRLLLIYPGGAGQPRYELAAWQSVYTGEWEADDTLNLWDGGEEMNLMGS